MVEGGWYFCPNEESADLASCAYCKLSLDGWEPKDNPFDEHYRRSSDCSFFVFAKPVKGKGSRSKKGRTSKASRQSTQSTASEILPSDVEDQLDQSVSSQPAKAKSTKKSSKSKSKASKTKKDEPQEMETQMDVDEAEYVQPETSKPKRSTRGRKRSSTELDKDTMSIADEITMDQPEPPAKKRATKRSTSRARAQSIMSTDSVADVPGYESEATHDEEDQKPSRGKGKKKAAKGRKASSTSKNAPKSRIPRDSELEAAIKAGLEGEEPQKDEPQNMEIEDVNTEKTTSKPGPKKSKSKKSAKKDPKPSDDAADDGVNDDARINPEPEADQQMVGNDGTAEQQDPESEPVQAKSTRRSSKNKADKPNNIPDQQLEAQDVGKEDDRRRNESFVSVEIVSKPQAEYSEVEANDEESKKTKKKASSEKTKKSKKADKADKKAKAAKTEEAENAGKVEIEKSQQPDKRESPQPEAEAEEEQLPQASLSRTTEPSKEEHVEKEPSRRRSSKVPPKTAERYSDISQDKQYARSIASDRSPEDTRRSSKEGQQEEPVSPLPSASRGTPSLSPQSSDAENHPPSMKASAPKPQLSSPSKNASVRFPLGTSTPSPSKRNASPGKLKSSHPWVPIDIDEIIVAGLSDKENTDLQSALGNLKGKLATPEKKMTVEEWIMWNAKNGEERLKRECERLVGQFEKEGARAMRVLEGIECVD